MPNYPPKHLLPSIVQYPKYVLTSVFIRCPLSLRLLHSKLRHRSQMDEHLEIDHRGAFWFCPENYCHNFTDDLIHRVQSLLCFIQVLRLTHAHGRTCLFFSMMYSASSQIHSRKQVLTYPKLLLLEFLSRRYVQSWASSMTSRRTSYPVWDSMVCTSSISSQK